MNPLTQRTAAAIKALGGPAKVSSAYDISVGHLTAVCEGRAIPGPRTLKAVGLKIAADGEIVPIR